MIMTVFAGIAEFERDLIRERTGSVGKQPNSGASALAARANSTPTK